MGNLNRFLNEYEVTSEVENTPVSVEVNDKRVLEIVDELGGKSFNNGIYHVYTGGELSSATELVTQAFPDAKGKILVFAHDWLGRQFAINYSDDARIAMFEPGSGDVFNIPCHIIDFHNEELVDYREEALALDFFQEWSSSSEGLISGGVEIGRCVGYKVPLFLGGEDIINNIQLIDLDVYLYVCGQLLRKAVDLKEGQTVNDITIS